MRRIGMVAAFLLAGCAGGLPTGGGGPPEVVMKRSGDEFAPPARDYLYVPLRSFVPAADGGWQEVTGARCNVQAGPYRAAAVTPVRLRMPDLGPDAPAMLAECSSGTARGQAAVAPDYAWPVDGRPDSYQRIIYAGWWWGYEKSGPLRYPDLAVGMR